MREAKYQASLIQTLRELFPQGIIIRNDPRWYQGIPDLLILNGLKWGMLELKADEFACIQPNQQYYVDLFDSMSFAAFIHPGNEEEVLHALQLALRS